MDSGGQIINESNYVQSSTGVKLAEYINSYSAGNKHSIENVYREGYNLALANLPASEENGNYVINYDYAITEPDPETTVYNLGKYMGLFSVASTTPEVIEYKKDANTTITVKNFFGRKDGTELSKKAESFMDSVYEDYYTEKNLYLVRSSIYENGIEKAQVKYTYDDSGNVLSERTKINSSGDEIYKTYTYNYGSNGELTVTAKVSGAENVLLNGEEPQDAKYDVTTVQKYDFLGNLISQTDGNGNVWNYEYDMLGRVIKVTDPMRYVTSYQYKLSSNETWTYDAENAYRIYAYDGLGNLMNVYGGKGGYRYKLASFEYDNLCRMTKETEYLNSNTYNSGIYTYDALNRITSASISGTAESGVEYNKYTYTYNNYDPSAKDANVGSVTITPADTAYAKTKSYYEINTGNLLREETLNRSNDLVYGSQYTYDYVGNMLSSKEGSKYETLKNTMQATYNYANQVLTETNADGQTLKNNYDMAGRLVSSTNYAGDTTAYSYNTLNQVICVKSPFSDNTTTETKTYYDRNGNVVRTEQESGIPGASSKTYNVTKNVYNTNNTLKTAIMCDGDTTYETEYGYYRNGLIKQQSVGSNSSDPEVTKYEYDMLNNLSYITDPLGQKEKINQYYIGIPESVTDKNGTVTNYTYNALGSVLSARAQNGGITESVAYKYDSLGNVKSMTDSTGTTNYSYDLMGRLSSEGKDSTIKQYQYNTDNNVSKFTLSQKGKTIQSLSYGYDNLNRLTSVSDSVNPDMKAAYTYTANGQVATEARGNNRVTAAYTYNKAGLLTKLTDGGDVYNYDYYANGCVKSVSENNSVRTIYQYNGLGQLVTDYDYQDGASGYSYDIYGNRTAKIKLGSNPYTEKYTYDKNNRLISTSKTSSGTITVTDYSYDPNGNQLFKTSGTYRADGEESGAEILQITDAESYLEQYEYNLFNRLTKSVKNGIVSTYTYDGNGHRMSKTVNGETTNHIWNNGNIIAETGADENVSSQYYYGLSLYGTRNGSTGAFYSYNGHGDVKKLISTNGAVLANYDYDAFGIITEESGNIYNPIRYTGQYTDSETGLIYLRNRYYDPSIGRFTQEDPYWNVNNMIYGDKQYEELEVKIPDYSAIAQSANLYVYCMNDPVNFMDPKGSELNYVSTFISEYGADIYVDDENRCTWVTLNGVTAPIYWDSENNWYFDSQTLTFGNSSYVLMDRTDFLNQFNINFIAVEKDYNPNANSALIYDISIKVGDMLSPIPLFFPGAKYDNYINQQYRVEINGEEYNSIVWVRINSSYSVNSWTTNVWETEHTLNMWDLKQYCIEQGYYAIH